MEIMTHGEMVASLKTAIAIFENEPWTKKYSLEEKRDIVERCLPSFDEAIRIYKNRGGIGKIEYERGIKSMLVARQKCVDFITDSYR